MPSLFETLRGALFVQHNWQQHLNGVNVRLAGNKFVYRRKGLRRWPLNLALQATLFTRVHNRHHLNVTICLVAQLVEIVDSSETDDCGAYGSVKWREVVVVTRCHAKW